MLTTALYHYDDDEIISACKSHRARDITIVMSFSGAQRRKRKRQKGLVEVSTAYLPVAEYARTGSRAERLHDLDGQHE